jgi:glutaredoxin 3
MVTMANVEIYTTSLCPYCAKAKTLLRKKNVKFHEIDVSGNHALRSTMQTRSGGRTSVPQIFIDGKHVGGCDDLHALDSAKQLDALLAA